MDNKASRGWTRKQWLIIFLVLVLLLLMLVLGAWQLVTGTTAYVVLEISRRSGISPFLIRGLVILATVLFLWALGNFIRNAASPDGQSLLRRLLRNPYGWIVAAVLVLYAGAFFISMGLASHDALAFRYCSETPEGIRTFEAGGIDPVYGTPLHPCTYEEIVTVRRNEERFSGPTRIEIPDPRRYPFFDNITGKPRVWYHRDSDGQFVFYDGPGRDPRTGEPLQVMDRTAIQEAIAGIYLNTAVLKQSGRDQAAILLLPMDSEATPDAVQQATSAALSDAGVTPVPGLFRDAFATDGRARRLFTGDYGVVADLGIEDKIGYIVSAESRLNFFQSPELAGLVTARLELKLRCFDLAAKAGCGERTIQEVGAGFDRNAALRAALEKARPQFLAFAKAIRYH